MTLQDRDKRALAILSVSLILGAVLYFSSGSPSTATGSSAAAAVESVPRSEQRLVNLRRAAATGDAKEALLKQVSLELAEREKGLVPGDTAEQAQAQLLQVLKRVAAAQTPPMEIGQIDFGRPRSYGSAYGLVTVSVTLTCRIDELVNFLTALSAQPELTATEDIRFGMANPKQKTMPVRLTVSGVVARRLVPVQKGLPQL